MRKCISIWCYAACWYDAARRRKSQYQLGVSDKWVPYLDSLKPLGLRCCVVCVMWGWGLVKVCIFHNQKLHVYLITWYLFCSRLPVVPRRTRLRTFDGGDGKQEMTSTGSRERSRARWKTLLASIGQNRGTLIHFQSNRGRCKASHCVGILRCRSHILEYSVVSHSRRGKTLRSPACDENDSGSRLNTMGRSLGYRGLRSDRGDKVSKQGFDILHEVGFFCYLSTCASASLN